MKRMIIKIKIVITVYISEGNVNSINHGAQLQYVDALETHYGHLFEREVSRKLKEEFGRALERGKESFKTTV